MTDEEKTQKPRKAKPKTNTMDMILINSKGTEIKATGKCTDLEIKAICKALDHTENQHFGVKENG